MTSNQLRYGFDPIAALKIRRCHQVSFERFMQKRIIQLLNKSPGLKAREIASQLVLERKVVSLHLHENLEIFIQDPDTFGWSVIKSASFVLELTCGGTWLTDTHFEKALSKSGSPLDADHGHVTIKIPGERKILLCAAAKILAIANQLAAAKKKVELDFSENKAALSYLNRAGFVDRLNSTIKILPKRPSSSAAQRYNANNIGLVEFLEINAYGDNSDNVPERLKNSFIEAFGKNNSNKLFTVVSEFVANVEEHSGTVIPGFAGLQCYGSADKRAKVITVISDSGKGICETLRPAIDEHLPLLAKKFDPSLPVSDPKLILHAMLKGGLSSREGGGGAGLHNSHSKAVELNATIKIRQENFSVLMEYKSGVLENKSWTLNLPKLIGTHIVFEFSLTKTQPLLKLEP